MKAWQIVLLIIGIIVGLILFVWLLFGFLGALDSMKSRTNYDTYNELGCPNLIFDAAAGLPFSKEVYQQCMKLGKSI